jgi:hypothetical protein
MTRLRKIQLMNDNFRTTLAFGAGVYMSRAFYELPAGLKREAFERVRHYCNFAKDGHHDTGLILFSNVAVRWRIECRSLDLKTQSRDPSDPERTIRVLIMEVIER